MSLADFIVENMGAIMAEWVRYAHSIPPGAEMDLEALRDDAEGMLRSIVEDMRKPESSKEQEAKSKEQQRSGSSERTSAEMHAFARRGREFDINQLGSEFRALRASVVRLWIAEMKSPDRAALDQLTRFNEALDQELFNSIREFSKELDRSRELFMGIIGHDLRSPLSAISMSAQYQLQSGALDNNNNKAAVRIFLNAQQMEQMITDLLDVTRLRLSGGISLRCEHTDLAPICKQALDQAEAAHPDRSLELHCSGDLHGYWDPGRLLQVLSNLIENAVKHGDPEKSVTLSVAGREDVVLEVRNQGQGISESSLPKIFDPLFTMKSGSGSFGLGLYIASTLVHQHKGTIRVKSSDEEGTAFTVCLPRKALE